MSIALAVLQHRSTSKEHFLSLFSPVADVLHVIVSTLLTVAVTKTLHCHLSDNSLVKPNREIIVKLSRNLMLCK